MTSTGESQVGLKTERRQYFRTQAAEHAQKEPQLSSQINRVISGYFRTQAETQKPQVLGCYQALPGEPNLTQVFSELKSEGYDLAFPAIEGTEINFFRADREDQWQQGPGGIREPAPERAEKVELSKVKTMLVPGLAFDKRGGRLGRGKGFYDRALKNFKGTKIGVTFAYAVAAEELPCEPHDIRMDLIITEAGVHECARKGT